MLFLIGFMVFWAGEVYAWSPYSWATYYALRRTEPVTIDGDLSEWKNVKGFTMAEEKFFYVGQDMSSAKWKGPKDLAATFKILWDKQYIYIAVEVTDDKVTEPHGALDKSTKSGSWEDDSVEFELDNDGCGMPRFYVGDPMHHEFHFVYSAKHPFVFDNFWTPQPGAPPALYVHTDGTTEPMSYPGEVMLKNDVTARFSKPPYNGEYAFQRTPQGYNLELRMSLPGATMAPVNQGGHVIGFDIAINDNDLGYGPTKQELHWSGINDMFWRNLQFIGRLYLLER
jgi:hypothetical protein